jgi:hypothetical protein
MRCVRATLLGLGMLALGLNGCQSSNPRFTPPPLREEYILPPMDDARFSNPPTFPKEAMDAGNMKKDNDVNQKFGGPIPGMGKGTPSPGGSGF